MRGSEPGGRQEDCGRMFTPKVVRSVRDAVSEQRGLT